ncbi:hypothetical protein RISK_002339 [Rhodopirellula islandica]|uniref:Helix-turn-helix domain-containing protein n=1 Tax=Rhodopirellula islandica TaxID=595434 RepID=A0A0J1BGM7_RHOIS|nr:hypothetical protein RISK_002339 [Rhodopirellula islandica]
MEIASTTPDELADRVTNSVVEQLRHLIQESSNPILVDSDEMARLASISRPTLDRLRSAQVVPSVLVGRRRLYRPDAVVAALEAQAAGGADHV